MSIIAKMKRRPFPMNLSALRACRVSYSQFGEDLFLTYLLGYEKTDGVFVDVGCFQPIVFSNTYIFSQRGWKGLAIDPNPQYRQEWRKYRPGDTFLNLAVSAEKGKKAYIVNRQYPAMNTVVDEDEVSRFGLAAHTISSCDAMPLSEILKQHLRGTQIDLMNIDCEGRDLEVIGTNDFDTYRPRVIAIEDSYGSPDTELNCYLVALGYEYKAYIGLTKIFEDRTSASATR